MSSAVMERVVAPELPQTIDFVTEPEAVSTRATDRHPLVPVFIAGAIAFTLAVAFVGSIVVWIALRNTAVMAP